MTLERRGNSIAHDKRNASTAATPQSLLTSKSPEHPDTWTPESLKPEIYIASGEAAIKQYQLDQARAKEQIEAAQKKQEDLQPIANLVDTKTQQTNPLITQAMQELGYQNHRGEWRKRNM